MIPEIGHFALVLALALALIQSVLPIWGAARNDAVWMQSAKWSSLGQVVFVGIAFAALMTSFVRSDFTVVNVVENSNSLKPMLFKIAGTWGSHEGSLLLWGVSFKSYLVSFVLVLSGIIFRLPSLKECSQGLVLLSS